MLPEPIGDTNVSDAAIAAATLAFIEAERGQLLLHSGGVAAADGRVVVVHGRSGSGKTTLTTALVASGLAYLTDETVCLDPDTLEVQPFPKPLTVKPGSQQVLRHLRPGKDRIDAGSGNWQLDPGALGGPPIPDGALRPALIVFPDFRSGHVGVDAGPVSPARAAFVLGEQSSALWAVEPRPLAALARLVGQAPAYRVTYGDAHDAAPMIVNQLLASAIRAPLAAGAEFAPRPEPDHPAAPAALDAGARERGDGPRQHAGLPSVGSGGWDEVPRPGALGPGLRWADAVDWVELDGEAVLFDGEQLHHLDVPGAATWRLLDGTRDLPAVAAALAEAFGADADRVLLDVEDLARVLQSQRLLTRD